MSYLTTDLIAKVKRAASIPTSQSTFQNTDFLEFANDELLNDLVSQLLSVREEYFSANQDVSIQEGKDTYSIPSRAVGMKLREVQIIDNDRVITLTRLDESARTSTRNDRTGFFIQGNKIIVSPTPTSTSTQVLRLIHYRRPNRMVMPSECGQINDIDRVNNQVTLANIPATFTNQVKVDFIRQDGAFDSVAIDQVVQGISGAVITFTSLPEDLEIGDWVALAGETPIPQIPIEFHAVLAQMVAVKCLEALGDDKVAQAGQKLMLMKDNAFAQIADRVDGQPKKVYTNSSLIKYFRGC